MSTPTTNMSLLKGADGDNSKTYLETSLAGSLDIIDIHDHSVNSKGLAVGRLAATVKGSGGNTMFGLTDTGSAVNYLQVLNAATAGTVEIQAAGTDSAIPMRLRVKGASIFQITDDGLLRGLSVSHVASAISSLQVQNAAAAGSVKLQVVGTAAPISFRNQAGNADNVVINDNGTTTFRNSMTLTTGNLGLASGQGLSSAAATDTLRIQPGGNLAFDVVGVATPVSYFSLTNAAAGGNLLIRDAGTATGISFRNNAANADNLLISDAGVVTIRSTINSNGNIVFGAGSGGLVDYSAVTNGAVVGGTSSFLVRDHTNANTNLSVSDAGVVTTRSQLKTTGFAPAVVKKSANYTLTADDFAVVNNGAGANNYALPNPATTAMAIVKNVIASTINVNRNSGESIFDWSGTAQTTITVGQGKALILISDGTNWHQLAPNT